MIEAWAIDLDRLRAMGALAEILSDGERQRAAAFHFDRDRNRWMAARACLRLLLAGWTGQLAEEIELTATREGKPCLARLDAKVQFNVSHTSGWALIVLSSEGPVGVDLEQFSRGADIDDCHDGFLSVDEKQKVATMNESQTRYRELMRIWCAKEAALKAIGTGLLQPPQELEILWRDHCASIAELRLDVHFPNVPQAEDLCAAIALSAGLKCPAVKWFEP